MAKFAKLRTPAYLPGLDAPPLSPPHTTLCIITVHSSSMPSILVNVGVGMVMLVDIVVSGLMATTMTMVVIEGGTRR